MRNIIKYLIIVVFTDVIIVGLIILSFGHVGNWLYVNRKPVQSDAIIILAGDTSRAFYAADLFLKDYAPEVYISRAIHSRTSLMLKELGILIPNEEEIYRQVLKIKGVPDEAIFIFGDSSLSTPEEAKSLKPILGMQNQRLLIVTSPFHVRRAQMIFDNILLKSEIIVIGTPYDFHSKKWWKNKYSTVDVINETIKILFYKLGYHFDSSNLPVQYSDINSTEYNDK